MKLVDSTLWWCSVEVMVKEHAFISYLILLFSSTLESKMINSELMIYTKKTENCMSALTRLSAGIKNH